VNDSFKYRVFLSYSHGDQQWADWLHRALETYRVPSRLAELTQQKLPRRIAPVFRDRDELPSAASLSTEVNRALEASESLLVICSPNAAASTWVNEEILAYKRLGRAERIFCLIVDGEPNTGDGTECFPPALRFELAADGTITTEPAEPIAADARPGADGRTGAKLKLIAGILGVGFDALRQRDTHRRHRRLLAITAGSVLVMFVTVTLAILAILAQTEAEQRRAQAEDLIGFMLGDLRTRLHEIGRLDIFTSVGNKAMDYFAALGDEDVSDSMLAQRAKALRQIGNVQMDQGQLSAALGAFRESLVISGRLAERDVDNAEYQVALANSHYYVGFVHWQRGELGAARAEFEIVLPIIDAVAAREPDNTDWLVERGYAHTNLGRILELEGQFEKALAAYQTVMTINTRLNELQPDNIDWQLELGFAHNNIGKLVTFLGRLPVAENHYREDLAIKIAVSGSNPQHNLWRGYLAVSYIYLGRILATRGNFDEAKENYAAAILIMRELLHVDPGNITWLQRRSIFEYELSVVLRRAGALDEAHVLLSSAMDDLSGLSATDTTNALWTRDVALVRIEAARQTAQRGDPATAIQLARSARETFGALLEQEPGNRETRRHLIAAELTVGDVAAMGGDDGTAGIAWLAALEAIERDFALTSDPVILDLNATLLRRLDRAADAATLSARLRSMGYRSLYTDLN